jgi:4-carboxymuconolactone decarboxylase
VVRRLPPRRHDDLDEEAAAVWERVIGPRGPDAVGADGGLIGPFNAWVHAPALGGLLTELVGILRYETSLDRPLIELAILVTAARWRSEYEWFAHEPMARASGVASDVIAAIREGRVPQVDGDAAIVYRVAGQLATDGRLDDGTYDRAVAALGDRGMVELVSLCGFYALVSLTLNAFEVALPPGVEPIWRS